MSTLLSTDSRKQPPSIYTVMLVLSMVFMLIAVVTMWVELNRWFPDYFNTRNADPVVQVTVPDIETSRLL